MITNDNGYDLNEYLEGYYSEDIEDSDVCDDYDYDYLNLRLPELRYYNMLNIADISNDGDNRDNRDNGDNEELRRLIFLFFKSIGVVESINDGIVKIKGLQGVANGEMVLFCIGDDKTVSGLVLNLEYENVSAIVLGVDIDIKPVNTLLGKEN